MTRFFLHHIIFISFTPSNSISHLLCFFILSHTHMSIYSASKSFLLSSCSRDVYTHSNFHVQMTNTSTSTSTSALSSF
ncbi:hypothetical protein BDR07DRAFT_1433486 [Suillus spraguei]|nr:hypothetical protein BDR07DRAFT_1433486 [Suillus spraguei]